MFENSTFYYTHIKRIENNFNEFYKEFDYAFPSLLLDSSG